MKAMINREYGDPSAVLELADLPRPSPGRDEVLIEVRAAAVDPGVWILITGRPPAARLAFGVRRPRQPVRGRDLAGVVVETGPGVTGFAVGDEVHGTCDRGSFAEFTVAPVKWLAHKPARLSFAEAAAIPVSGQTALDAIRAAGPLTGRRIMIIGAGGGIGAFAVQLAVAEGAHVTAVCGPGKAPLMARLGADRVIDYTRAEIDSDGPVHDVILDTAGCRPFPLLRRALTPTGTVLLAGGGHDAPGFLGGFTRLLGAPLAGLFGRQRLRPVAGRERAASLVELGRRVDAGRLTPVIDRTFPLSGAASAVAHLAEGHPTGKIVITMGE
ncbi:NADPH:quinone reductase-like Zn-dependent oxidoreductase [Catenuloplanes nepalensis]|uniref:NADPH:quinone reductase-like Zn-dependent oxidoreductase n=1 Tax=Catenuloplanes nepalensis TaxID=587533 RepID=A0ABT9MWJ1_9ACTN|nr:NAD(P)-dependent alcohol dehydrogenase [Catenuloplanes nepalensis]MDP9795803.1 NADPH:quinone reductase-like Zn-dependent oxidoreductase [Catenuloplanes nepalensis]